MAPLKTPHAAVLLTQDILDTITSYQQGICADLRPFVGAQNPSRELNNFLQLVPWHEADRNLRGHPLASFHDIISPWYKNAGHSRLCKLLACLPHIWEVVAAHAVCTGNLAVLTQLPTELLQSVPYSLTELAAASGHINVVEYLVENSDECTGEAMIKAAHYGHLNVVRFLHDRTGDDCASAAIVFAASQGHHEVVRFLHTHRPNIRQLKLAMFIVARTNYVAIAAFVLDALGKNRHFSVEVMDEAARHGQLAMVQLLHQYKLRCSVVAIDSAASNGHLDVVKWLHVHRTEGCTEMAMDGAAVHGHAEVVQYLHANRQEGCSTWTLRRAAERGH
ncbi:hypothetical protein H310_03099 [Aphanomyces invadans]|uniref:Ankyrin repeat-containing domain n=1 Tax=Aphanomyces invadans TaxID=157072 RepID=A0A024UKN7_9STRA|nr:hypothetical protein H310_03099 [Aphanomyces invadans]ETW07001.1 hypothetical protein H310_03099 [Aphanomyces invadans]|eukprot:XP_008865076.1 hypothetical protein H310_03099 [Aphanomyces invadans]